MKLTAPLNIIFSICITLVLSCNDNTGGKTGQAVATDTTATGPTERRIGQTNFYITLPADYSVTQRAGRDFTVYYFMPTDTSVAPKFLGGMYLGTAPSAFPAESDTCTTTALTSKLLGGTPEWTVYICSGEYNFQTIVDNKSEKGWNGKVHVFGGGENEAYMNKMLGIYATLVEKQ